MKLQVRLIRYVFLDIVGFTKDRSVQDQLFLVNSLNKIIRDSIKASKIRGKEKIFIPTGDGMAIAILKETAIDIHLKLAVKIVELIAEHNEVTTNTAQQFQVRIGVNQNHDFLVKDINKNRNVAGQGISKAQRIMDQAKGDQIMVGMMVHETLSQQSQYMGSFRKIETVDKHGNQFPVYQYISQGVQGLDIGDSRIHSSVKRSDHETKTVFPSKPLTTIFFNSSKNPLRDRWIKSRRKQFLGEVKIAPISDNDFDSAVKINTSESGPIDYSIEESFQQSDALELVARLGLVYAELEIQKSDDSSVQVWLAFKRGCNQPRRHRDGNREWQVYLEPSYYFGDWPVFSVNFKHWISHTFGIDDRGCRFKRVLRLRVDAQNGFDVAGFRLLSREAAETPQKASPEEIAAAKNLLLIKDGLKEQRQDFRLLNWSGSEQKAMILSDSFLVSQHEDTSFSRQNYLEYLHYENHEKAKPREKWWAKIANGNIFHVRDDLRVRTNSLTIDFIDSVGDPSQVKIVG